MTALYAFLRRLYADIQHNNRIACAIHAQRNKQQLPPLPRRGAKKGKR